MRVLLIVLNILPDCKAAIVPDARLGDDLRLKLLDSLAMPENSTV